MLTITRNTSINWLVTIVTVIDDIKLQNEQLNDTNRALDECRQNYAEMKTKFSDAMAKNVRIHIFWCIFANLYFRIISKMRPDRIMETNVSIY
jgi:hypothetical protein